MFDLKTFYGQLENIYVIRPSLDSRVPTRVREDVPPAIILAFIRYCKKVEDSKSSLDIHYFKDLRGLDVIDITSMQCLVSRILLKGGHWVIIDQSRDLSRAIHINKPEAANNERDAEEAT